LYFLSFKLAVIDYGKCYKGHELSAVDSYLMNDIVFIKELSNNILSYLEKNKTQIILNLSNCLIVHILGRNQLGDVGAMAITEVLKKNPQITLLSLSNEEVE